jgi:DNA repair photolyase
MTRKAIKIIVASGNAVNILTKGGIRACQDFDLLAGTKSKIGATLTFMSNIFSREWEPGAALPEQRIQMLMQAKSCWVETWASIEPVIIPSQSLAIMEAAMPWVDTYKIGKWNHDKRANEIDWKKFVKDAVALCERYGKRYVLKQDLLKFKEGES